ncbi:MAG: hypothetical protein U0236_23520 [Nitrospira sp.]
MPTTPGEAQGNMTIDNLYGNPNAFTWRYDAWSGCDGSKMKDPTNLVFYKNATLDAVQSHMWTDLGWGDATGDDQCFYEPNDLVVDTIQYADGPLWGIRDHIRTYSRLNPETFNSQFRRMDLLAITCKPDRGI